MSFQLPGERSHVQTPVALDFSFFNSNKKMMEILMKICLKITIIVVENRKHYYIIFYKCKEVPLSVFSYQMLASTFDFDKRSSYYVTTRSMCTSQFHHLNDTMMQPAILLSLSISLLALAYRMWQTCYINPYYTVPNMYNQRVNKTRISRLDHVTRFWTPEKFTFLPWAGIFHNTWYIFLIQVRQNNLREINSRYLF